MSTPTTTRQVASPLPPRAPRRHRHRHWILAGAGFIALALVTTALVLLAGEQPAGDPAPLPTSGAAEQPEAPVVRYDEEPPANWDVTDVAADDQLNVRSGPGAHQPVTGVLPPTTIELESTGRIARVDGVLWREIQVPGATSGWVAARFLAEHRPLRP